MPKGLLKSTIMALSWLGKITIKNKADIEIDINKIKDNIVINLFLLKSISI